MGLTKRKPYKATIPEREFILRYPDGGVDGPFDPECAQTLDDGSVVLLTPLGSGIPRVLRVTKQDGAEIQTADSGRIRFELAD